MKTLGTKLLSLFGIGLAVFAVVYLMQSSAGGVVNAAEEIQSLSLKMAVGRLLIVIISVLFGWKYIAKAIEIHFHVDIAFMKYRVLFWYLAAEAVIVWSLLRG